MWSPKVISTLQRFQKGITWCKVTWNSSPTWAERHFKCFQQTKQPWMRTDNWRIVLASDGKHDRRRRSKTICKLKQYWECSFRWSIQWKKLSHHKLQFKTSIGPLRRKLQLINTGGGSLNSRTISPSVVRGLIFFQLQRTLTRH